SPHATSVSSNRTIIDGVNILNTDFMKIFLPILKFGTEERVHCPDKMINKKTKTYWTAPYLFTSKDVARDKFTSPALANFFAHVCFYFDDPAEWICFRPILDAGNGVIQPFSDRTCLTVIDDHMCIIPA